MTSLLFDGEVTGVRIEPMQTMPGLSATVLSARMRPTTLGRRVAPHSSAPTPRWWSATACPHRGRSAGRRFIGTPQGWLRVP